MKIGAPTACATANSQPKSAQMTNVRPMTKFVEAILNATAGIMCAPFLNSVFVAAISPNEQDV